MSPWLRIPRAIRPFLVSTSSFRIVSDSVSVSVVAFVAEILPWWGSTIRMKVVEDGKLVWKLLFAILHSVWKRILDVNKRHKAGLGLCYSCRVEYASTAYFAQWHGRFCVDQSCFEKLLSVDKLIIKVGELTAG